MKIIQTLLLAIFILSLTSCATNEEFNKVTSVSGIVKEKSADTKTSSRSCINIETIIYKDTSQNKIVAKEIIKEECIGAYPKVVSKEQWVLKNNKLAKVK